MLIFSDSCSLDSCLLLLSLLLICSVAQSCPALWDPMDYSMPGFPVLHIFQGLLILTSIESAMPSLSLANFLKLLGWHFLILWSLFQIDLLNLFCPFPLICSISLLFSSVFWRFPWVYLLNLLLNLFFNLSNHIFKTLLWFFYISLFLRMQSFSETKSKMNSEFFSQCSISNSFVVNFSFSFFSPS